MAVTDNRNWPTRRGVLEGGAATGLLLAAGVPVRAQQADAVMTTVSAVTPVPTMPMTLRINAEDIAVYH